MDFISPVLALVAIIVPPALVLSYLFVAWDRFTAKNGY